MNLRNLLAELNAMAEEDPSLLDKEVFIREAYGPRLYPAVCGGTTTCYQGIMDDEETDTHFEDEEDAESDGYELSSDAISVITIETPL